MDSGTPDVTRASRPPRGMIDALDKRLFNLFDPKGYANEQQCLTGLDNHRKILKRNRYQLTFLGLDNWSAHLGIPFRGKDKKANIKVVFVPGGTTELTAPIDVGAGQHVKLYVTKC